MPAYNQERHNELIAAEAEARQALQDVSERMATTHADCSENGWEDATYAAYCADGVEHARLERELNIAIADRRAYDDQEPSAAQEAATGALARWIGGGANALEAAEQEEYLAVNDEAGAIFGGNGEVFRLDLETRSDDTSGQEAVPETVQPRPIDRLVHYGGVAQMAQQFITATGNEYRVMQMDAASQNGEIIGAQATDVTELDLPDLGVVTFGAKTGSSKMFGITREMIQDSVFDIQSYVERQAVRRLGRAWNGAFTKSLTGGSPTGTGWPEGVVSGANIRLASNNAGSGITAASATGVSWVELTNLIYEIDRAYREGGEMGEGGFMSEMGGRIGYMISDDFEKLVRTLRDSDGRPLWVPSTREGAPGMLNGYPYVVNGDMDSVAAKKIPCLFGNFSYYGIRTVRQIEIFRFMDSQTMKNNSVKCLALSRRDARYMGARVDIDSQANVANMRCEAVASLQMK